MAMKMKKQKKSGTGIPAPHPRMHANNGGDRNSTVKSPGPGLGRSISSLLDRTRAYFRQAETA